MSYKRKMLGYDNFTYNTDNVLCCDQVDVSLIAQEVGTPFYIYSYKHIKAQYQLFQEYFPQSLVAFAIKSCPNISIVRLLAQLGCGADIVSLGELHRALKAGICPEKIMFSGVGKTAEEITFALEHNIGMLNVESASELRHIAEIATQLKKRAPISLRVNPDVTTDTFPGIATGKRGDKFGIPQKQIIPLFKSFCDHPYLDLKGIDFHIGSQVLNVHNFAQAFEKMRILVLSLKDQGFNITHLDCGGGLGVPYRPEETAPNIKEYAKLVHHYFGDLECHLAFEPGRFITANSAILVSRVLYYKSEPQEADYPQWHCLVVDAAMNDLARPAIYRAHHHIVPVHNQIQRPHLHYDIVGPVCESTDTFVKNYPMQRLEEGALLAFLTAGAYGASMSSRYNSRLDIPEIIIDDNIDDNKGWRVIRRRATYEDLFLLEQDI